jgi:predicted hydrolase (HD superfamily)
MSLRDYFAAKAMQGLIHHFDFGTFRDDPERLALWAYDAADAMLKEREEK